MALMTSHGLSASNNPTAAANHRWPFLMGIELELENVSGDLNHMLYSDVAKWNLHEDASLRNGMEFVTSYPFAGQDVEVALDQYFDGVTTFSAGPRTSTHIHINITDTTDEVVKSMFFLMYVLEEGVYALTEETRKWAGYSMPLREMAPSRIRSILQPFSAAAWRNACHGGRNSERYYGFNINWARHGTVEFRYFPGGPSREELEYWLDLPTLVREVATNYSVDELARMFSTSQQLVSFIRNNFGKWGEDITAAIPADQLMQYYEEVSGLYGDLSNPINSPVIYLGDRVKALLYKNLFQEDATKIETFNRLLPMQATTMEALGNTLNLISTMDASVQPSVYQNPFVYSDDTYEEEYDSEEYVEEEEETQVVQEAPSPTGTRRTYSNTELERLYQLTNNAISRINQGNS